jgi:hypothetical protein
MREGAGTNHHVRLKLLDAVALEWSGMVAVFNSLQPSSPVKVANILIYKHM